MRILGLQLMLLLVTFEADLVLAGLNRADRQLLNDKLVPAASSGSQQDVLAILAPWYSRLDAAAVSEADSLLRQADLPNLKKLLLSARLAAIESRTAGRVRVSPEERQVLVPYIHELATTVLRDVEGQQRETRGIEKADFLAYEHAQRDALLLSQEVQSVQLYFQYVDTLPKQKRLKSNKSVDDSIEAFQSIDAELKQVDIQLARSELEMRVQRLYDARDVLVQLDSPAGQRLLASIALLSDATFFKSILPKQDLESTGQQFDESHTELADRMKDLSLSLPVVVAEAKDSAGARMLLQAYHFSEATRWWLRGRFGQGPLGGGALKVPEAKGNPHVIAQLLMPLHLNRPLTAAGSSEQSDLIRERRHHYAWRWENRGLGLGGYQSRMKNPKEFGYISEDKVFR